MRVDLNVPIFQRRVEGGGYAWLTIGLGEHNEVFVGGSVVKLQRRMVKRLRETLSKLAPSEIERIKPPRGLSLERVRAEFLLEGGLSRQRISGRFPLIFEPRFVNDEERALFVYHPERQQDWFIAGEPSELESELSRFFRASLERLPETLVAGLKTDDKDRLLTISFSVEVPSLCDRQREDKDKKRAGSERRGNVLHQIGADQTARAIEGTLPLGAPRPSYQRQLVRLLTGAHKRSLVMIGRPGVGKSTLIHRAIADLLDADEYPVHRNLDKVHHVWRISGKRIIAGMTYLGDWEQRCLDLLDECKKKRGILWIEDIHLFGQLGRARQSDRNLAELFRGPAARGELVLIGECTPEQWQRLEDDAPGLASSLAKVMVNETTAAETMQMIIGEARLLEQRHGVAFHPFSYRSIMEIGGSLFPWTAFPGKALELLRQLAEAHRGREETIDPEEVLALVSNKTGLPKNLLTLDEPLHAAAVREGFQSRVMGQSHAVDAACELVFRIRAGLTDPKRPYAVMLFTGPTGTGKTEMARCIAEYLYGGTQRLLRIDMSELSGPDAVPRLIGDRFEPEGLLTQRIREQPFSVVLLDEIDKAHRSVLHLLLQLFDEARLTDAAGNAASFHNAVVIMTSNLGARPTRPIGFGQSPEGMLADIAKAVREFFPPELFNRIDRVVPFTPLTREIASSIATKELARLLGRRGLRDRNIFVYANDAVKSRLVDEAFDPRHGARTVKRYLEERIGGLLAEEISRRGRANMQVVRIYEQEGDYRLHVEPLVEVAPSEHSFPFETLVEEPLLSLRDHIAPTTRRLEALMASGVIDRARETARQSRDSHALFYWVDWYADELSRLCEWFAQRSSHAPSAEMIEARTFSHGEAPRPAFGGAQRVRLFDRREGAPAQVATSRDELLDKLAHAAFLERHADPALDPAAHRVWLELLRMGMADTPRRLGDDASAGLMEWMAQYLSKSGLESAGLRYASGRYEVVRDRDALLDALKKRPLHLVVELGGYCARDRWSGEAGCHIWRSPTAEPEIVRVRPIHDEAPDAASLLEAHIAARRDFESALDAGHADLPDNPEHLAPAVRTLSFRRPLDPGAAFDVDIEDFRCGYTASMRVRSIEEVLGRMATLWIARS